MKKDLKDLIAVVPSIMAGKEAVTLLNKLRDIYYLEFGNKPDNYWKKYLKKMTYKRTLGYKMLQGVTFLSIYDRAYKLIYELLNMVPTVVVEDQEGEDDVRDKDNVNQTE